MITAVKPRLLDLVLTIWYFDCEIMKKIKYKGWGVYLSRDVLCGSNSSHVVYIMRDDLILLYYTVIVGESSRE